MTNLTPLSVPFGLSEIIGANGAILTSVRHWLEYADNKSTGKRLGTRYDCALPLHKYASISVKVLDTKPAITQEELDDASGEVRVTFDGFVGKFYRDHATGNYNFTAKADAIRIL